MVTLVLPPEAFELLRHIFGPQSQLQLPVGVAGHVVSIQQAINDALAHSSNGAQRPA
jgi:hypothetical protein